MQYGKIAGIDKPVSRLVQGTAAGADTDRLGELLGFSFENGINTFDSAHVYGPKTEGALGKWINDNNLRDKVVIIAKGAHHTSERNRVTPEDIEQDMNESMERMGVDYFDAYVLHRDDPSYPVGPIVEAFNKHAEAGRIGAFGGSNWSYARIEEANRYAVEHGLKPFAISSPNVSLAVQVKPPWGGCVSISDDADAKAYYASHKDAIAVLSWSSLAGGFFSGRFNSQNGEEMLEMGGYFDKLVVESYYSSGNFERLARAETLASKHNASVAQIALAYVLHQDFNVFPLMFCRSQSEFAQNAAAIEIELSEGEIDYLALKSELPS